MLVDALARVPAGLGATLAARGFTGLLPIQAAVLDPELGGRDLHLSSQTGSGKTVALGLAIADDVARSVSLPNHGPVRGRPSVLLVAPTRELAVQLADELTWLLAPLGATVVSLTGGTSLGGDFRQLKRDPQVLVGTPGRIRDHLERGTVLLDRVRTVALDEADEMLAMGFEEDVAAILEATPAERRTHLVSATFPPAVRAVAARHQRDPVTVAGSAPGEANADISYHTMTVPPRQTLAVLVNVLLLDPAARTLVFVRTRTDCAQLAGQLADLGFGARPLSGDLNQRERTAALESFQRGRTPILVATDVAARGLDVPDIAQVIHVGLPDNAEVLTHRSGRTGRAGRKGRSLVLVPPRAAWRVEAMLRQAGVTAVHDEVPGRDEIDRCADRRLGERLADMVDGGGDRARRLRGVAAALLTDRDPVAVVAALLDDAGHGGPCEPRDITAAPEPPDRPERARRAPRGPRPSNDDWTRFQVSWGEEHGADPRRLLAVVCRRGGIGSSDVGAITIGGRSSMVEVSSRLAESFSRSATRPDPRDPRIKFRPWRD